MSSDQVTDVGRYRRHFKALCWFLIKSGLIASAALLVLFAAVRTTAIVDAPVVSRRADLVSPGGGIVYNLPLDIEVVDLDWAIERCDYNTVAQLFEVTMAIAISTRTITDRDPKVAYRIENDGLLSSLFSNSISLKFYNNGFIKEFALDSTPDVLSQTLVLPATSDSKTVQIPPQAGLPLSPEDQCGRSVVAALRGGGDKEVLSDRETKQIIPRYDGSLTADGVGLIKPFQNEVGFGPVIRQAAIRLAIDIRVDPVEGAAPAEPAPEAADGIIFRSPGLAMLNICIGRCDATRVGDALISTMQEFAQLGRYTVIPVVRRPFSTLAVAISADSDGRLQSVHLGERQALPGQKLVKDHSTYDFEIEEQKALAPDEAPSAKTE